jgi:cell division protein ZapA (FtsZ GTPase activity inhibitor)
LVTFIAVKEQFLFIFLDFYNKLDWINNILYLLTVFVYNELYKYFRLGGVILDTLDKEIVDDKLTQADLIKLMLHNAQHMATREEVKDDIYKLDQKIDKVEVSLKEDISKLDQKIDKVEASLKEDISKLDQKIDRVELSLKEDISKLDQKIDRVELSLKEEIKEFKAEVREDISRLDNKISKVDAKFDKIQWLIIATLFTVLFKDYILSII